MSVALVASLPDLYPALWYYSLHETMKGWDRMGAEMGAGNGLVHLFNLQTNP